jgi:hypothetical protein
VKGIKSSTCDDFGTPPNIPDFYGAQRESSEKKEKKMAGRENSNLPTVVEKEISVLYCLLMYNIIKK